MQPKHMQHVKLFNRIKRVVVNMITLAQSNTVVCSCISW